METYTAEEILEIVHGLDLPGEIIIDDDQDVCIEIEFEEFSWRIQLGSEGPFFASMSLIAAQTESQISHSFINRWNQNHLISTAYVLRDEDTEGFFVNESNEYVIAIKSFVSFFGSIPKENIAFSIYVFQDDACEFFGVQAEDEVSDVHAPNETPDGEPIPLIEQIQLELALNAPQSARTLAKSLNASKYEVNSTLYRHSELFEQEGTSPPLWTNKP